MFFISSLTCRNIYVNKNNRDYSKNSKGLDKSKNYISKKCECCSNDIPYEKRRNKYCCSSCSTKITNKRHKGMKYNLTEIGKESLRNCAIKNFKNLSHNNTKYEKLLEEYNINPKKCLYCNNILTYRYRNRKFCNMKCKKDYHNNKRSEFEIYKNECKFNFNIKNYPNEFEFDLIEKYGWYKAKNRGNNLNGVSRDHMYSITEGFKNNIEPEIISHPANCKLMTHPENNGKNFKCSISIEELKNKIEEWNKKYK